MVSFLSAVRLTATSTSRWRHHLPPYAEAHAHMFPNVVPAPRHLQYTRRRVFSFIFFFLFLLLYHQTRPVCEPVWLSPFPVALSVTFVGDIC